MKTDTRKNLWTFRQAREIRPRDRFMMKILVAAGIFGILKLADWWFREEHVGQPVFYIVLSIVFWWSILRLVVVWTGLLRIRKPPVRGPTPTELRVAIITTT